MSIATTAVPRGLVAKLITIFLPFAAGYHLSYLFRTVNALLADRLTHEFALDAAQLGMLTSAYFLTAAAAQVPLGALFDRYGPGRVQGFALLLAAAGAALFALADGFLLLLLARAMIGLGVAGALMGGLKALVLWFDKDRLPFFNGWLIALGAAGALTSSYPLELALGHMGWRELFVWLAGATALVALAILLLVPRLPSSKPSMLIGTPTLGFRHIYSDTRFWRLAPLSALVIGSAWALQGLWAAPWLREVAHEAPGAVVSSLFAMGVALCSGALVFGICSDRLRRRGIGPDKMLIALSIMLIAAMLCLAMDAPVPPLLPWSLIGMSGAATVLSYSIMPALFPREVTGRANGALNVLHFGAAFAIQNLVGQIVCMWPRDASGHYPPVAYGTAFVILAALQAMALAWFWLPREVSQRSPAVRRTWPSRVAMPALLAAVAALLVLLPLTILRSNQTIASIATLSWRGAGHAEVSTYEPPAPSGVLAVVDLRARLDLLQGTVQTQRTTLLALQTQLSAGEQDLAALRPVVTELRQQVAQLQQQITNLGFASVPPAMADRTAREMGPPPPPAAPAQVTTPTNSRPSAEPVPTGCFGGAARSQGLTLTFDRNQQTLQLTHHAALDRMLESALACRRLIVRIDGYSDGRGTDRRNVALSQRRAELTAKYFEAHGVGAERMVIAGHGATRPVADNETAAGRAVNRRVEVLLDPGE
jgi:outer membrane protein OmpA-like peptidoglycan-associated protein/MFS family permease